MRGTRRADVAVCERVAEERSSLELELRDMLCGLSLSCGDFGRAPAMKVIGLYRRVKSLVDGMRYAFLGKYLLCCLFFLDVLNVALMKTRMKRIAYVECFC